MANLYLEKKATLDTVPYASYDQNKWTLGELIQKQTDDLGKTFLGPLYAPVFRPFESAVALGGSMAWALSFSSDVDWFFWGDVATAAATRRIMCVQFTRSTRTWGTAGFITVSPPPVTVGHTIRGFRMTLDRYTTGTAAVSGTAVTGTAAGWFNGGALPILAAGSRIGFGTSDPSAVGTWYEIASVNSDNSITLTASAGTIGDGAYVIEELRCVMVTTNTTLTNGGLFVAKGLRIELFTSGGTTIAASGSTVDNLRLTYWLADAATVTNTIACGCAIGARTSWSDQSVYVMDTLATPKIYKYNIRAPLSLTAGKATNAWVLTTGVQAVTGTNSQVNNGRMATAGHGPGSGVLSFYFVTTTRVYRAAESGIVSASTTWITDAMIEVPPGSITTFLATAAIAGVEYSETLDRFMVISSGSAGLRSYVTRYNTTSDQFDHIFLVDDKQLDQTSKNSDAPDHPSLLVAAISVLTLNGLCYILHPGVTAPTSFVHVVALGAHWTYAGTAPIQRLISPRFDTTGCERFIRAVAPRPDMILGRTKDALGISTDPIRMFYRLTGISGNTGSWTVIGDDGDLSAIGASAEIQLMFEFRTITQVCMPARVMACGVSWEDSTVNDAHYRQSVVHSNATTKIFAFRFAAAFGGTVPTLRIRIYNDVSGALLVDDNSAAPSGTWEKSTNDGGAWGAYNTTDKANDTTYIRWTPASLADSIKARARLTLL